MTQEFTQHPTCDLCKAQKMTPWFHEDDTCWIAECDICAVPMVVWRFHGPCPPDEHLAHMRARIAEVAAIGAAVSRRYVGAPAGEIPDAVLQQAPKRVGLVFHPTRIASWDHRKLGSGA